MKHTVLLLLALLILLTGCTPTVEFPANGTSVGTPEGSLPAAEESELLCILQSEEEAQEVAALYGIELVAYKKPLATFLTKEDPRTVIEKGKANGWPELSLNDVLIPD